jgi:hypothetical protein
MISLSTMTQRQMMVPLPVLVVRMVVPAMVMVMALVTMVVGLVRVGMVVGMVVHQMEAVPAVETLVMERRRVTLMKE